MATVPIPISFAALITLIAISPRFEISILEKVFKNIEVIDTKYYLYIFCHMIKSNGFDHQNFKNAVISFMLFNSLNMTSFHYIVRSFQYANVLVMKLIPLHCDHRN